MQAVRRARRAARRAVWRAVWVRRAQPIARVPERPYEAKRRPGLWWWPGYSPLARVLGRVGEPIRRRPGRRRWRRKFPPRRKLPPHTWHCHRRYLRHRPSAWCGQFSSSSGSSSSGRFSGSCLASRFNGHTRPT
ncbi:MAG: hypothetical protein JXA67_19770 [Micromonosporaceae bacterium]|nr:hypothetical protein [Micromonosporaceae bacterium]